jgi:hypothetical protein
MIILDYKNGIDPECGIKYDVINDIIITPFWTKEFCNDLVKVADFYQNRFNSNIEFTKGTAKQIGWADLSIDKISPVLFEDFVYHYKNKINPLLKKIYSGNIEIDGWFSPYIIRYNQIGQHTDLHHDVSTLTLNIKLNNEYEGCDLVFPRQEFSSKNIPVGSAMIWPSTVTHPHGSTELNCGTKYSFVSWTWPQNWQRSGIGNLNENN